MKKIFIAKGQTLVEVLVAIVVAALLLISVTSLTMTILRNSTTNDNQSQALSYAQQGLEFLRNQYNSAPTTFTTSYNDPTQKYCLDDSAIPVVINCQTPLVPNVPVPNSIFVRWFQINAGSDCPSDGTHTDIQVNVSVAWTDSKCSSSTDYCHASQLETCLSNASNF